MARRPSFRLNAGVFDLGIAGFAAVAIGFAGFALPEWRLNQLLQVTGLPEILAAAQPPLGLKARLGAAAALAAFTFAAVYLLMRLLDRVPSRRNAEDYDNTIDAESLPIRLRRADRHPDNPVRRPLIAGRELGEPFDELLLEQPVVDSAEPVESAAPIAPAGPLPSFLEAEVEPPVLRKSRDEEIDFLDLPPPPPPLAVKRRQALPPIFERVERDPQAADPILAAKPVRERSPLFDRATPIADPAPAAAPAAEPAPPAEPIAEAPPRIEFTPVAAAVAEPEPRPEARVSQAAAEAAPRRAPAAEPAGEESITDLMARLETGLRRREHGQPSPASSGTPLRADESIAERLRSAMTDLQKLTARG